MSKRSNQGAGKLAKDDLTENDSELDASELELDSSDEEYEDGPSGSEADDPESGAQPLPSMTLGTAPCHPHPHPHAHPPPCQSQFRPVN